MIILRIKRKIHHENLRLNNHPEIKMAFGADCLKPHKLVFSELDLLLNSHIISCAGCGTTIIDYWHATLATHWHLLILKRDRLF